MACFQTCDLRKMQVNETKTDQLAYQKIIENLNGSDCVKLTKRKVKKCLGTMFDSYQTFPPSAFHSQSMVFIATIFEKLSFGKKKGRRFNCGNIFW